MTASLSLLVRQRRPDLDGVAMEEALRAAVAAAEQEWPALALDVGLFMDHLAERMPPAAEVPVFLATLHASDLYLACSCSRRLPAAIAAFERVYLGPVAAVVVGMDPSPDFVDEVRQRLRERLLVGPHPRITDYAGKGSLKAWLGVAATRLGLNLLRTRRQEAALVRRCAAEVQALPQRSAVQSLDARLRRVLEDALRAALGRLASPDRRVLRMYYVEHATQEELAQRLQVHRRSIIRRLVAAREHLLQLTRQEVQQRLPGLDADSRESLFRELQSQVDLNLKSALQTRND